MDLPPSGRQQFVPQLQGPPVQCSIVACPRRCIQSLLRTKWSKGQRPTGYFALPLPLLSTKDTVLPQRLSSSRVIR